MMYVDLQQLSQSHAFIRFDTNERLFFQIFKIIFNNTDYVVFYIVHELKKKRKKKTKTF